MRILPPLFLLFLIGIVPAAAEEPAEDASPWYLELLSPSEALPKLNEQMREVPRAQWSAERMRLAREYLEAWEASGREPAAEDLQPLYSLHVSANRYAEAADLLLPLVANESAEADVRREAAVSLASLLRSSSTADALGEEGGTRLVAALEAYLPQAAGEGAGKARASIHQALAAAAARADDAEGQIRHMMLCAMEDPGLAAAAARTVVRALQGSTHDLEGYEVVRTSAAAVLPVLRRLAEMHLEEVQASGDERALGRAEAGVRLLGEVDRPLQMLGRPAEEWTLEKAYGDVTSLADLKGKVVVLDFWATWCPWCIRSFPALRDLLRDYADADLAVVGVTASASSVYEQRYDLDDDLKDRQEEGARPTPVARKARDGQAQDGTPPTLLEEEYREVERQVLGRFIENHEMTWPVVLIDNQEPGPKYALTGWPHAVVLDREGRIRYFKVGALLRDRPEAVAAFRKVLDDLLAEGAESAAE